MVGFTACQSLLGYTVSNNYFKNPLKWFQVWLSNTNNLYTVTWHSILLITIIGLHTVL